jgi:hypothetical protein
MVIGCYLFSVGVFIEGGEHNKWAVWYSTCPFVEPDNDLVGQEQ